MAPHHTLSKRSKAKLLSVNLSSCYLKPKPVADDEITLMNEIRDIYSRHPFKGYRRITWDLKDLGHDINRKRVYRLMQKMGLQALYPKKNLSLRNQQHKVYPYLLKEHPPQKPHDAWCVDITYIKIANGFVYLTALIDVVSRFVVGYHLGTSLDTESCLRALKMAIDQGYRPLIINTDQGCQFTSQEWLYNMALLEIRVSMDGKGRCLDNIPIERFWRTVKYEEVYLKTYENVQEARESLGKYILWYNNERRHSALGYNRPYEVMMGLKQADSWPFKQGDKTMDNSDELTHSFTPTTTKLSSFNLLEIRQPTITINQKLSSHMAA
jgi:putative transposase